MFYLFSVSYNNYAYCFCLHACIFADTVSGLLREKRWGCPMPGCKGAKGERGDYGPLGPQVHS